jgi:hypothetical protein
MKAFMFFAAIGAGLFASGVANACEYRLDFVYPKTIMDKPYPITCAEKLVKPATASESAWRSHLRYVEHLNRRGYQPDPSPPYIRTAGASLFDSGGGGGDGGGGGGN